MSNKMCNIIFNWEMESTNKSAYDVLHCIVIDNEQDENKLDNNLEFDEPNTSIVLRGETDSPCTMTVTVNPMYPCHRISALALMSNSRIQEVHGAHKAYLQTLHGNKYIEDIEETYYRSIVQFNDPLAEMSMKFLGLRIKTALEIRGIVPFLVSLPPTTRSSQHDIDYDQLQSFLRDLPFELSPRSLTFMETLKQGKNISQDFKSLRVPKLNELRLNVNNDNVKLPSHDVAPITDDILIQSFQGIKRDVNEALIQLETRMLRKIDDFQLCLSNQLMKETKVLDSKIDSVINLMKNLSCQTCKVATGCDGSTDGKFQVDNDHVNSQIMKNSGGCSLSLSADNMKENTQIVTSGNVKDVFHTVASDSIKDCSHFISPDNIKDISLAVTSENMKNCSYSISPDNIKDIGLAVTSDNMKDCSHFISPNNIKDISLAVTSDNMKNCSYSISPDNIMFSTPADSLESSTGIVTLDTMKDISRTATSRNVTTCAHFMKPDNMKNSTDAITSDNMKESTDIVTMDNMKDISHTTTSDNIQYCSNSVRSCNITNKR